VANLSTTDLKRVFIASIKQDAWDFSCEEGNPFMVHLSNERYFVYLKNISPAFLSHSPDVTRIQLKHDSLYDSIPKSIPIVILGYDGKNSAFVSWNPKEIRNRINTRKNVSLYSRNSLQSSVKGKSILTGSLSNGSKFIVFKKNMLLDFFRDLDQLFEFDSDETLPEKKEDHNGISKKITRIEDKKLIKQLTPLLKNNRVLEAATLCHKHYSKQLSGMRMKDWLNIANEMYLEINRN